MNSEGLTRRTFCSQLFAVGATLVLKDSIIKYWGTDNKVIKLGVIADLHGGFAIDAGRRLDTFLKVMKPEKCDALLQLGDFAFPDKQHQAFADKFNAACETTVHVIGNHEFDHDLNRADCIRAWGIPGGYYRRDVGTLRILVLDGNEAGSPDYKGGYHSYIGEKQRTWLKHELQIADRPVLILSHQPLAGEWPVDNAEQIQKLIGRHQDKVIACLNGHSHIDSLVHVDNVAYLHINSASYFWVGGEARTAYYKDPLFTMLTIDPATAEMTVQSRSTEWRDRSPEELSYFDRDSAPSKEKVTPQIRGRKFSGVVK